jgi:hypothetical protein
MLAGPAWAIPADVAARQVVERAANEGGTGEADGAAPTDDTAIGASGARALPPMVRARDERDVPDVAALVEAARRKSSGRPPST